VGTYLISTLAGEPVMAATIGGTIKVNVLTLLDLKVRGFFLHRDSDEFPLRKHLDRMPYGCKSSDENYLSGCDISVCCIATT
jgi:hypothetical protein